MVDMGTPCRTCGSTVTSNDRRTECGPCRYARQKASGSRCACGSPMCPSSRTCKQCLNNRPDPAALDGQRRGWVAGIVEGEGTLLIRKNRPYIRVQMTDEDTIDRLASWTGIGVKNAFTPRNPKHKASWMWTVQTLNHCGWLIREISPLLGVRRREKASLLWAAGRYRSPIPVARPLSRSEKIGWVSGMIEGEGCISVNSRNEVSIELSSVDSDVIHRLQETTGIGRIYRRPSLRKEWKPAEVWRVARITDAYQLLQSVEPLLSTRRANSAASALAVLSAKSRRSGA